MSDGANMGKVTKAGIWYTISNFLLKGMGFITIPLFARLMTKGEVADYGNYQDWLYLLTIVVTLNLYSSINRARFDFEGKLEQYCSSILLYGSLATAVCYAIVWCNMETFTRWLSMDAVYIHSIFVYLLLQPALEIFQAKQRVTYHYKTSVGLTVFSTFATTIASVLLVIVMHDKYQGRVIGYIVPMILVNVVVYCHLVLRGRSFRWEYFKYAFLYSWPFIPHLLAMYVLAVSDRLMILNYCGKEPRAIYTIACNCVAIATTLMTSMNGAISPWIFDKLNSGENHEIRKVTVPFLLLYVLPIQLVCIVAPEILWILGGTPYAEARLVIVPLLVASIFQFVYCLYVNIEQYARKTWAIGGGAVVAAAINVGLNLLWIPRFGYTAAAYTTLIGYMALFVIHFVFVRIIGYKKVYDDKFVFLVLGLCLLSQPLIMLLYHHTLVRYAVFAVELAIDGILLWRYRGKILSLLKRR